MTEQSAENDAYTTANLSLALRKAARDYLGLAEGDFWPSEIAAAQARALLDSGWRVIPPERTNDE